MAVVFIEGFDKYRRIAAGLFGGDWTTTTGDAPIDEFSFVPGAYEGDAFSCPQNGGLVKSLPGTYGTIIWGLRFNVTSSALNAFAVLVADGTTAQFSIRTNASGFFEARTGSEGGSFAYNGQGSTLIATSTASISINQWHYLECKVTIGSSGSFNLYLDGALILSETGVNTQVSSNAYVSSFIFKCTDAQFGTYVDDLYIFDTTTAFNNNVVGDSVVETQYPSSDSVVQFVVGASAFGNFYHYEGSNQFTGANVIYLTPFKPQENCTINSISIVPADTSISVRYTMVIYSDLSNSPHTLLSAATEVVGATNGITITGDLITPQSLLGGTQYWLGFMTDTNIHLSCAGLGNTGFNATYTYSLGAPATAPSMTGGIFDYLIWGNVTSLFNYAEVNGLPLTNLTNYVTNSSVGDEDQYNFPALTLNPLHVYAVKVSAWCQKSDAGARTINLMLKSGATDSGGDNTGQAVTSSFQYLNSHFNNDPNTGLSWDYATVNTATSGVKVVS